MNIIWMNTVEYRYNVVQYNKILHKCLQELRQNINQMLDPRFLEKIDRVITAPRCIVSPAHGSFEYSWAMCQPMKGDVTYARAPLIDNTLLSHR